MHSVGCVPGNVGKDVGELLGVSDGCIDGVWLGVSVSTSDGVSVGTFDGSCVGVFVGKVVSGLLGISVG